MSKTYHTRYKMRKEFDEEFEYSPEFEESLVKNLKNNKYSSTYSFEKMFEDSHEVDVSHTTFVTGTTWGNVNRIYSRHPNKKKHPTLSKEFKGTSPGGIKDWRSRFGERNDKSDRMKSWRISGCGIRRAVMKMNNKKLIEEELNNQE